MTGISTDELPNQGRIHASRNETLEVAGHREFGLRMQRTWGCFFSSMAREKIGGGEPKKRKENSLGTNTVQTHQITLLSFPIVNFCKNGAILSNFIVVVFLFFFWALHRFFSVFPVPVPVSVAVLAAMAARPDLPRLEVAGVAAQLPRPDLGTMTERRRPAPGAPAAPGGGRVRRGAAGGVV